MTSVLLLAAVSIVFPREGARLPMLPKCHLLGATDGVETSLVLRAVSPVRRDIATVPVHRTGAWGALMEVFPGMNVVEIGGCRRTFYVATASPKTEKTPAPVYKKLEYAADSAQPHPSVSRKPKATIVIDAGHGGKDSGTWSPHDLPEKDANLRMAWDVRRALELRGFKVVMTRDDDRTVELRDRPKKAHAAHADAFVSIHHNAPGYVADPSKTRFHAVYAWNSIGTRLAKAINARMRAASPGMANRGVVHANFVVMRNPQIPSCLVEVDFITHPDGESAAWDASRRGTVAASIADGIADWVAGK